MSRSISIFLALTIFAIGQNEVYAIVHGVRAEEGEFPYMVQILDRNVDNVVECGGTILSPEWILTRGMCQGDLFVALGSNRFYHYNASYIQTYNIKNYLNHPKYNYTIFRSFELIYDVGLIQVDRPIVFTDKIQPIKLPDTEDIPYHVTGTIAGWGPQIQLPIHDSDYLLKHDVQISTDKECQDIGVLSRGHFNPIHHLCSIEDFNRVCLVDRGGPLVINGTQYAIMSWDNDFCGGGKATAYTRITNPEYRDWIRNVTGI